VELIDLPDFGPDEFGQIIDGESDPFGTDHLGISWQSKSDHVGLIDEGRLIASAGWVAVDARVANGPSIEVLGLGGVVVHRDRRGSGVGGHLVLGTMKKMRDRHGSIALLFCRPERQPFYQRLGWFPIADEVTVGQPGGATVMPLRTCWTPLSPGEALPAGALRFEGLPF
jgi:GNAT superfamily N-acetyltransferase